MTKFPHKLSFILTAFVACLSPSKAVTLMLASQGSSYNPDSTSVIINLTGLKSVTGVERGPDKKEAASQVAAANARQQAAANLEAARQQAAANLEAARQEAARQEAARQEAARQEADELEAAKKNAKLTAAELKAAELKAAELKAARLEAARLEAARLEAARLEAARLEAARLEAARLEAARLEAPRSNNERVGQLHFASTYSTQYNFRGLNILDRISPDNAGSGVSRAKLAYTHTLASADYLTFEYARLDGYDALLPRGAAADSPPNARDFDNASSQFLRDNADFSTPGRKRYGEDQFFLKYTKFLPWELKAELSTNYYRFNDGRWYQDTQDRSKGPVNDTWETQLRVSYEGPRNHKKENSPAWATPSLTYSADWAGFKGQFLEFDVASRAFDIPGKWVTGKFNFHGGTGYDFHYNAPGTGWSYAMAGTNVLFPLDGVFKPFEGSGLKLGLSADYVQALDKSRADSGWFFGASLNTTYNWIKNNPTNEVWLGKDALSQAAPLAVPHKWRVSAGTGWRNWTSSFQQNGAVPYDSLSLIDQRQGSGDLGFATARGKAQYKNGSVNAGVSRDSSPTGSATFSGGDRRGGQSATGDDRHVIFQSDRFEYDQEDGSYSRNSESDTALSSPYLHFHRDLTPPNWAAKGIHFGLGALYSFSSGDMDSGIQATSHSFGFETIRNYEFIYARDAIREAENNAVQENPGSPQVVIDGGDYSDFYEENSLKQAHPQSTEFAVRNNMSRVASFTSSSLKFQAHEIAIPLEISYDVGTRLHMAFSLAPTLTYLDANLTTTTDYRQIPDLEAGEVVKDNTGYKIFTTTSIIRFDDEEVPRGFEGRGFSGTGQASSGGTSPTPAASGAAGLDESPAGGRGGRAKSPRLPGRSLLVTRDKKSSQEWTYGVTATASVRFDLDEQDRFFVEAWGRYGWLQDVTISNRQASVNLDPSSWAFGVGIGCRF